MIVGGRGFGGIAGLLGELGEAVEWKAGVGAVFEGLFPGFFRFGFLVGGGEELGFEFCYGLNEGWGLAVT